MIYYKCNILIDGTRSERKNHVSHGALSLPFSFDVLVDNFRFRVLINYYDNI